MYAFCNFIVLFILLFFARLYNAFERSKEKHYNRKYYANNKEQISEKKKVAYQEELDAQKVLHGAKPKTQKVA